MAYKFYDGPDDGNKDRYNPKVSDWDDVGFIPFQDKFGQVYKVTKDSDEYWQAIKDDDIMLNKAEYYKYLKNNGKANDSDKDVFKNDIAKYYNPHRREYNDSTLATAEQKMKGTESLMKGVNKGVEILGNVASLGSLVYPPLAGIALTSDAIQDYRKYQDSKPKDESVNDYNYLDYIVNNPGQFGGTLANIVLDFPVAKPFKALKTTGKIYQGAGAANDTYQLVDNTNLDNVISNEINKKNTTESTMKKVNRLINNNLEMYKYIGQKESFLPALARGEN